jgi:uncharacterized iron-regulated protein
MLATTVAVTVPAQAANRLLPEHRLAISFDLDHNKLTGTSQINLPADQGLELYLDMVTVTNLLLNNVELPAMAADERLVVPPKTTPQEIFILFEHSWPAAAGSLNLIDANGIALTDIWHPMSGRDMMFSLSAEIPPHFSAVSEAEEIIVFPNSPSPGIKQVVFRFPHPLRSLHFAAGPYILKEETLDHGLVLASYFFEEDQEMAASYQEKASSFLKRYENLIGPYPYKRFAVVENRLPTGFSMPTFTLLGQAVLRLPFIKDTSLGHEILHQWFGNSVGIDRNSGNWAEGLTAYLADQAFTEDAGQGLIYRKEQLIKYASYVPADNTLSLNNFTGADDESQGRNIIRAVGYSKASMFFHMLEKTLGTKLFIAGLQDFYLRMRHRPAGWPDLQTSFENAAGIKLSPLFEQWLTWSDIPHLAAGNLRVNEDTGRPTLSFDLLQENSPPYQLTVPLVIKTIADEIHQSVTITEAVTPIQIPLNAAPLELILDPNYDLMRSLTPAELPPTWSRFEGAAQMVAIIDNPEEPAQFAPFVQLVKDMNGRILADKDVTQADLASAAILLLGTTGKTSQALFAEPGHRETGVTIDIRNNPLNIAQVAVLVSADKIMDLAPIVAKLKHYGKYSFLYFADGRNQEKRVAETENGIRYFVDEMPPGIKTDTARSFAEITKELLNSRVIYVGEVHTNYQDHILQLKIIRALHEQDPSLAVGMEMFSRSTQPVLDDYIAHRIDEKIFLKQSDYFEQWSFDYRLYRDLLNFARRHRLPVIGLNVDRQIVSGIFQKSGAVGLSAEDAEGVAQNRDLDLPGYRERLASVFQNHPAGPQSMENNEKFNGFLEAQAVWDETMAETIAKYLQANPNMKMVIIAGRGHTYKRTAIPPRVLRRLPIKQSVVMNINQEGDLDPDEADYLFFSPAASLPPAPLLGVLLAATERDTGAQISDLSPQGQAKEAGLKKNDVIIAIDNQAVSTVADVKINMAFKEDGDTALVKIRRKRGFLSDEELDIAVSLTRRSSPH